RPMISAPDCWFSIRDGATESPATWADTMCLATILPDVMLTSMFTATAACEFANPPRAMPCPFLMFPLCLTELATLGVQLNALAALTSASRHCHWPGLWPVAVAFAPVPSVAELMLVRRNWYGSCPLRYARWSINCSQAKHVCGALGARSVDTLK